MNNKIAVDIALLLPPKVVDVCVGINKELDQVKYVSFQNGYQPHITLAMGCIAESNMALLREELSDLARKTKILNLNIIGFEIGEWDDDLFLSFNISKTPELVSLHNTCMELMKKYATYESNPQMFFEPKKMNDRSINWVNNYKKHFDTGLYSPHISLGPGPTPKNISLPIQFSTDQFALFQLGKNCTCKNLFA